MKAASPFISTLLHLRIPFSYYLLPVFLFAWSVAGQPINGDSLAVFFILHFLVYPASNGFNSYFDRDEGPIGGLAKPPVVYRQLYFASLCLDAVSLIWTWLIDPLFAGMIFVYGMVSKAYSHPLVRLKKYAVGGWLTAGFFQGYFTFIMIIVGFGNVDILALQFQLPAILSSLLLFGSYPMTQIYQHNEDRSRGDMTISMKLGIKGTFLFTAIFFTLASVGFIGYFMIFFSVKTSIIYVLSLSPVLAYFGWWYWQVKKNPAFANHRQTMRLNFISATCLNLFFAGLPLWH